MATTPNFTSIIEKKKNGEKLTKRDIDFFLSKLKSNWNKEDVQIGALLMAINFKGLDPTETSHLTEAMLESGESLRWPESWKGDVIDKHSTGGVGDKVSLVLAPALAALGYKVPMISGRGLEHTGGTIDKLESIPGYNPYQSFADMVTILDKVGCCIVAQSDTIAPKDNILYPCRDVTCTVNDNGLITGSIMSKKLAESLVALVLDVKCGRGAFMKTPEQAKELAEKMVESGEINGVKTRAVITNMDRPIGKMIGNALEVVEAVETLQGNGSSELKELVKVLGGHLLVTAGKVKSVGEGAQRIETCIQDMTALDKFRYMIINQGVKEDIAAALCDPDSDPFTVLPKAKFQETLRSSKSGFVKDINPMACARISNKLGASSGENINPAVGLQLHVIAGELINEGAPLVTIHYDKPEDFDKDKGPQIIEKVFEVSSDKPKESKWVIDVIQK